MKQPLAGGPGTGRVLLRTQSGQSGLYRAFNIVFACVITFIAALVIFHNPGEGYTWYSLLLAGVLGVGVFWLLNLVVQLLHAKGSWAEPTLVILLFAAFIALQVWVGLELRVTTAGGVWDYDYVYSHAVEYVRTGTQPDSYFQYFPGNIGVYSLLCLYFGAFNQMGMADFTLPALILNVVCIDLAIFLLYRSARLLMGKKKAVFALLAALCVSPFVLLAPILYSDTLSLPFPIAAVYLWLRARQSWRKGDVSGTMGRFVALSLLTAIGALLKLSVAIVWVAIVIDLMLMLVGSGRWIILLAGAASFCLVVFGGGWLLRNTGYGAGNDYTDSLPFAYWLMMGLNGDSYGAYTQADTAATLAAAPTTAGRSAFAWDEVQARLSEFGVLGTLTHLMNKLRFTFGDASYQATTLLGGALVNPSSTLADVVVPGAKYSFALAFGSFAVHATMFVGIITGTVKSLLRKNDALTFARIALFGLVLLVLLWETTPHYIASFLPVMVLLTIEALPLAKTKKASATDGKKPDAQPEKEEPANIQKAAVLHEIEEEAAVVVAQPDLDESTLPDEPFASHEPLQEAPAAPEATETLFEVEPVVVTAYEAPQPKEKQEKADPREEAQPENLFDDPKKTVVVETTHTQLFDVPTGDPFYEMAHTASWKVSEVREADGQETVELLSDESAGQANTQPAELFALFEEVLSEEPAPREKAEEKPVETLGTQAAEEPVAPAPDVNIHDAFTRAAVSAFEETDRPSGETEDLFAGQGEVQQAASPAPLPPAGVQPDDGVATTAESEFDLFKALDGPLAQNEAAATEGEPAPVEEAAPAPAAGGEEEAKADGGQIESLWDFDD